MILFRDNKAFQKNQVYTLEEIKHVYPNSEVEEIKIGIVNVKTNQGLELQRGILLDVRNREVFKRRLKEIINELDYGE